MFCSFCIVPSTRGREISRAAADIVSRGPPARLDAGHRRDHAARSDRERLRAPRRAARQEADGGHDAFPGAAGPSSMRSRESSASVTRARTRSSSTRRWSERTRRARSGSVPHVHLPVQSGSNGSSTRMRRRYTRERYLEIVDRGCGPGRPDIAITTDLIVGFPGESEADFEDTLDLVRGPASSTASASSTRPDRGRRRPRCRGRSSRAEVAQDRLERLQAQQRDQTLAYHQSRVGQEALVLVEGPSRRGGDQLSGRDLQHRVVNLDLRSNLDPEQAVEPGTRLPVRIVEATPHSLLAEPLEPGLRPDPAADADLDPSRAQSLPLT